MSDTLTKRLIATMYRPWEQGIPTLSSSGLRRAFYVCSLKEQNRDEYASDRVDFRIVPIAKWAGSVRTSPLTLTQEEVLFCIKEVQHARV